MGDAFVAVAMVRNLLAMALVFAVPPWLRNMGTYDMFTLLGCLSLSLSITTAVMVIWGKKWRKVCADLYRYYATSQYSPRSA